MRRRITILLLLALTLGQRFTDLLCSAMDSKHVHSSKNPIKNGHNTHQPKPGHSENNNDAEVDFSGYMEQLQCLIKKNWHPPMLDQSKSSVVTFRVRSNGAIENIAIKRTSGNPALDQAGVEALLKTSPAQSLPPGSPDCVDVEFTFTFNSYGGARTAGHTGGGDRTAARLVYEASILTAKGSFAEALTKLKGAHACEYSGLSAAQLDATGKAIAVKLPPAEAAKLLRRALYINADDSYLRLLLETAMKKQGQDPASAQFRLKLARELRDVRDLDGSVAEYKECSALSGDTRVADEMAKVCQKVATGDLLERWQSALALIDNAENHTGVGYAYEVAGDVSNAEKEYRAALQKDSGYTMAKERLAALLARPADVKDFDIADLKSNRSVRETSSGSHVSNNPAVLNNAGVKLMNDGKLKEAIESFSEALLVKPGYSYAKDNLAIAYNNYALHLPPAQASKYFRKAMLLKSSPTTAANLSGCLKAMGIDPKSFAGRVKVANKCEAEKDYEGAVVEYRCALGIQQDSGVKDRLSHCLKLVQH